MTTRTERVDHFDRARARTRGFTILAIAAGVGAWLIGPFGVVQISRGDAAGWVLLSAGVILAAGCVGSIIVAARSRVAPEGLPGKANPAFDEPRPSANPNGGYSTSGMQIGGFGG